MKSLLLVSLLLVPSLKTVNVSTEITSLTGAALSARDVHVIATDLATGEEFAADQDGVLTLVEGAYSIKGEGSFCFLVEQNVVVTEETTTLSLEAGCE